MHWVLAGVLLFAFAAPGAVVGAYEVGAARDAPEREPQREFIPLSDGERAELWRELGDYANAIRLYPWYGPALLGAGWIDHYDHMLVYETARKADVAARIADPRAARAVNSDEFTMEKNSAAPPPPPEPLHSPPTERLLARLAALNPLADAEPLPRASSEGSDLVVVAHSDAGSSVVLVDAAAARSTAGIGACQPAYASSRLEASALSTGRVANQKQAPSESGTSAKREPPDSVSNASA